jgi:hypothetical protein
MSCKCSMAWGCFLLVSDCDSQHVGGCIVVNVVLQEHGLVPEPAERHHPRLVRLARQLAVSVRGTGVVSPTGLSLPLQRACCPGRRRFVYLFDNQLSGTLPKVLGLLTGLRWVPVPRRPVRCCLRTHTCLRDYLRTGAAAATWT